MGGWDWERQHPVVSFNLVLLNIIPTTVKFHEVAINQVMALRFPMFNVVTPSLLEHIMEEV